MPFEAGFNDGSPATALVNLLPRLGQRADSGDVREHFFSQENPSSLKALVEVTRRLECQPRAVRADLDTLDELPLPCLVHLQHPHMQEAAFVVLTARDDHSVTIEEGSPGESVRFTRSDFAHWWTGVAVIVEHGTAAIALAPPRMGLLRRSAHWLRGSDLSMRYSEVARRLAIVAVGALAIAGPVRAALGRDGTPIAALHTVAAIALVIATAIARELWLRGRVTRVPAVGSRLSDRFCKPGSGADCDGVLSSRWATLAGIDTAAVGYAFAASSVALYAAGALSPANLHQAQLAWSTLATLFAAPLSLYLIAVQIYPLKRFCPLCMAVHAGVLSALVAGAPQLATWWILSGDIASLLPWAIAHAVLYLGALGLMVPFASLGIEAQAHRTRLGWVGTTPWGALSEMLGRPRAPHALEPSSVTVGNAHAPLRLDLLVHPQCPSCGPVFDKLQRLVQRHASYVHVALHFPVRDQVSANDRQLCVALAAAGTPAFFQKVKAEFSRFVALIDQGGAEAALRFAELTVPDLRVAEAAVTAATTLHRSLSRGTPALILHGRPWEGSIEDLDMLLTKHPQVLAALLRLSLPLDTQSRP
ncbi:MAG: vitamin K epoxide reductase family protein [Acidobacteriota bacterium]